jgi:hypothetical protein
MPKSRLPLVQEFMSRDGTLGVVDSFVQNGCFDKQGDKLYVLKRPGTVLNHDFGTGTDPQGATFYGNNVYAVYSDTMYRSGGASFVGSTGSTFTQATTPAWYGRAFFSATVFQGRIYVIGGEATQLRADVSYSSDGVTWSQSASGAPFGHRQGHQCVAFNGQMFLLGGLENDDMHVGVMNDVWSTSDGANWTQVTAAAAWSARVNFTAVAANNGIYLYGGEDGTSTLLDDVWFSSDGETWTQLTATATGTPRFLNAMFFFQNKVWIVGGYADAAGTITINQVSSSPDGQTWTNVNSVFTTGKAIMAYTVYNNHMWLIGGDAGGVLVSDTWASSPDGSTWNQVSGGAGFTPRGGAAAVTFQTPVTVNSFRYLDMWMLGGNDGATDLQEVWYGTMDLALPSTFTMSPVLSGQPYQFNTFLNGAQLLIKNQSNFWILSSGTLIPVTDTNYPTITVPGLVVLNLFAYVMEPDGTIRACALEDATQWPSLQFVVASYEDDPGVAIAKYLNYLVAFGQYTCQFFYDAGNPAPGIALSPYQSTNIKVGLSFASTLQSAKNTLIWVAQTKERNWGVYLFDGLNPKKVSNKWVDKVLNVNMNSAVNSWITGMEGHTFYVLQFFGGGCIAYDMDTGVWGPWNSNVTADGSVPYSIALTEFFTGGDIWFGRDDFGGMIFSASFELYDDDGIAFDTRSQTDKIDGDTLVRKFFGQADLVADLNTATSTLEVSDDDYQTWNTWGIFDESRMRPMLNRGGSARRRAFRLTRTDDQPLRWEALEVTASSGES